MQQNKNIDEDDDPVDDKPNISDNGNVCIDKCYPPYLSFKHPLTINGETKHFKAGDKPVCPIKPISDGKGKIKYFDTCVNVGFSDKYDPTIPIFIDKTRNEIFDDPTLLLKHYNIYSLRDLIIWYYDNKDKIVKRTFMRFFNIACSFYLVKEYETNKDNDEIFIGFLTIYAKIWTRNKNITNDYVNSILTKCIIDNKDIIQNISGFYQYFKSYFTEHFFKIK